MGQVPHWAHGPGPVSVPALQGAPWHVAGGRQTGPHSPPIAPSTVSTLSSPCAEPGPRSWERMKASKGCGEHGDGAAGGRVKVPRGLSQPPTGCPRPHHVPPGPDPLCRWPRSGWAGKSGRAAALGAASWAGARDVGQNLCPLPIPLPPRLPPFSHSSRLRGHGARQELARASRPPFPQLGFGVSTGPCTPLGRSQGTENPFPCTNMKGYEGISVENGCQNHI